MKYEKNKLYKDYDGNLVQFLSENTIANIFGNKILILKYLKNNLIYTYENELYELTDEDKAELL